MLRGFQGTIRLESHQKQRWLADGARVGVFDDVNAGLGNGRCKQANEYSNIKR